MQRPVAPIEEGEEGRNAMREDGRGVNFSIGFLGETVCSIGLVRTAKRADEWRFLDAAIHIDHSGQVAFFEGE